MKKIQILGPGCSRCRRLFENTEQAARSAGIVCEIEKITDIEAITAFGVLMTPALVVDGKVKIAGKVPGPEEILNLIS